MVVVTDEFPSTTGVVPPPRRLEMETVKVSSGSPLELTGKRMKKVRTVFMY